ncbi:hypothetical protein CCHR01_12694 [Colletotrichum chrysophilum]|uniref:Uncharacterized protein n=1 Tax=Colletotrichum chrysophilum TaxID=1836956 RepID=A0AAD9EDV3_9PEZI|nr:hypothetical protein CCHR01_12694 [Colletotrichum chrysophilum]
MDKTTRPVELLARNRRKRSSADERPPGGPHDAPPMSLLRDLALASAGLIITKKKVEMPCNTRPRQPSRIHPRLSLGTERVSSVGTESVKKADDAFRRPWQILRTFAKDLGLERCSNAASHVFASLDETNEGRHPISSTQHRTEPHSAASLGHWEARRGFHHTGAVHLRLRSASPIEVASH